MLPQQKSPLCEKRLTQSKVICIHCKRHITSAQRRVILLQGGEEIHVECWNKYEENELNRWKVARVEDKQAYTLQEIAAGVGFCRKTLELLAKKPGIIVLEHRLLAPR